MWSEEFNQNGLPNSNNWYYDIGNGVNGWGLGQKQYYTNTNANVDNGFLTIRTLRESKNGFSYTSSKILSKRFFNHSVIEIRARLPRGNGTWPAFWLKGDGPWPDSGDLDIMEHVGYLQGKVHASIINKKYNNMIGSKKTGTIMVNDLFNNFHVYKLDWNSKRVKFFVDDVEYFSYVNDGQNNLDTWPFNGRFTLIINTAVGGDWFGYMMPVDDRVFPQDLVIDYIRQYAPNNGL